jgi:hypothetical protein
MMDILLLPKSDIIADRKIRQSVHGSSLSPEMAFYDTYIDTLIAGGGENFLNYLRGLGLEKEPNIFALSSRHYYYYDFSDLKGVNILINLKKLNRMRHLDSFLITVRRVISPETRFMGCFSDKSTQLRYRLNHNSGRRINNYSDAITDIQFDRNEMIRLLESHGFKVCDMTMIKGLTYFMAKTNVKLIA